MQPPPLAIPGAEDRVILERPNFILRRFVTWTERPPVLVVAPLSGHFGWLMRDTVIGLVAGHDVWLLEWKDASDIPLTAGRLAVDAPILAVMECLRALPTGMTVLGVSQAPTAILAAAALMAAQGEPHRPGAMVLMGGFIDTRRNPTAVETLAARLPPGWFTRHCGITVPANHAGSGRRVYPAAIHVHALNRYLARHLALRGELYRKVTADDRADPKGFPFLAAYSTLMDLPAEFVEDNVRQILAEARLARGLLTCRGRAVEPDVIDDIALMTVEGGADDSSGLGQTHAAHALCPRLPSALRRQWTEAEAGHFGLFHGEPWRSSILPRVAAFIGATQCQDRVSLDFSSAKEEP
ncbi:MAG: polyhydroxyalkanoate depolymerase [Rhodospirillaceae bacterium]|nr:polyhydroxyalkanoate depolymerase [Rhodospirillales bacterium]